MTDTSVKVQPVSEAEFDVSYSGPAYAANRFFVFLQPGGVRITFAEQPKPDKSSLFRAAVMLSHQDAINLANILKTMLAPIEAQIAKVSEPSQDV